METTKRNNIVKILAEREEFLVIGLTGRVGSGCSEAANIFCSDIQALQLPQFAPGDRGFHDDDQRDKRIITEYYNNHWLPFDIIQVRTIITTFLLDNIDGFIKELLEVTKRSTESEDIKAERTAITSAIKRKLTENRIAALKGIPFRTVKDLLRGKAYNGFNTSAAENATIGQTICPNISGLTTGQLPSSDLEANGDKKSDDLKQDSLDMYTTWKQLIQDLQDIKEHPDTPSHEDIDVNLNSIFKYLCQTYLSKIPYNERHQCCDIINRVIYACSAVAAEKYFSDKDDDIWNELGQTNNQIMEKTSAPTLSFSHFNFVHDIMPAISAVIHEKLSSNGASNFTELYQKYGNCIRQLGRIEFDKNKLETDLKEIGQQTTPTHDIFSIPRKINQFIKVLRHPFSRDFSRPTRVVIDSIKNNFEATYLRERYSAFYLFSISADEPIRINRLMENRSKRLNLKQINFIDWNEYSSIGKDIYDQFKKEHKGEEQSDETRELNTALSQEERDFINRITETGGVFADLVREQAYQNGTHQFILQDVKSCIESADVFISNNSPIDDTSRALKWEIVRNICLILYPGLVQPTPIERCMQIAFTAKANSGCLSRQVGAVVTDADYRILSIGWNDVPCGDISCSRKNLIDLCKGEDISAYSHYELNNKQFRKRLPACEKIIKPEVEVCLCGLPLRYCFKDIHISEKNPMRSRAMHAEEKAMGICGKDCEDGNLFTTSSPCEMCSKKAKNHKIKNIYYIEPYPGISEDQYSRSGDPENIAKHILFTGAIGRAYTQMYTPIMPQKDILDLLGIYNTLELPSK